MKHIFYYSALLITCFNIALYAALPPAPVAAAPFPEEKYMFFLGDDSTGSQPRILKTYTYDELSAEKPSNLTPGEIITAPTDNDPAIPHEQQESRIVLISQNHAGQFFVDFATIQPETIEFLNTKTAQADAQTWAYDFLFKPSSINAELKRQADAAYAKEVNAKRAARMQHRKIRH